MDDMTMDVLNEYARLFVHCWDYYAVQYWDSREQVWSYRPAYHSLTLSRLVDHLQGRYTLGTYAVDRLGFCSFVVFDDDRVDGLHRLALLAGELAEQGISLFLEVSRRGGHGWVFFERPLEAYLVRRWFGPYARRFGMELYPTSDRVAPGGVGHLVRLPLGVHRKSGRWYPFVEVSSSGLVPVGETVGQCCSWVVSQASRVQVDELGLVGLVEQRGTFEKKVGGNGLFRGGIREWCSLQDIIGVVGRYTDLDGRGVGRCPLPGHHRRGDVHPSFQVFAGNDPHWYCYTWKRAGNVFDFLQLYYGLPVEEMWKRLREGTLF